MLLEWCDRTPQFSGLFLQASHRPTSLTQIDIIVSFTNLTEFALYNHACYNIEILLRLLTFLFNVYKRFLVLSGFLKTLLLLFFKF